MPDKIAFAAKPAVTMKTIGHALETGIKPDFILADEVYEPKASSGVLSNRAAKAYVLAVASCQRLWVELQQRRVDEIAADAIKKRWFQPGVADSSKGPRIYDWNATKFGVSPDSACRPISVISAACRFGVTSRSASRQTTCAVTDLRARLQVE